MDRKFIMEANKLEESRIKLIKVFVMKVKDVTVLSGIIEGIKEALKD